MKKIAFTSTKIRFRQVDYINICGTRRVIPTSVSQRLLFLLTLFLCLGGWIVLTLRQHTGFYYGTVCQRFEVNFDDFELDYFKDYCNVKDSNVNDDTTEAKCPLSWINRTEPIRYTSFNDVYIAELDSDGTVALRNDRPIYHQRAKSGMHAFGQDSPAGEFSYCDDEEAWVFTIEGVNKGIIDEKDAGCNWLMKSRETDAHSLHEVDTDGWIVWTGIIKVVQDFSISCVECEGNDGEDVVGCTYHGQCVEESCVCNENWMGNQCETCVSCHSIETEYLYTNGTTSTSLKFLRMDEDDTSTVSGTKPFEVYGRPVYYLVDEFDNIDPVLEIILYDGNRYVIWDLKEDETVNVDDDLDDIKNFLETLHSTWDFDVNVKLRFGSEKTNNPMPFGHLQWFDSNNEEVDLTLDCSNQEEKNLCIFAFN